MNVKSQINQAQTRSPVSDRIRRHYIKKKKNSRTRKTQSTTIWPPASPHDARPSESGISTVVQNVCTKCNSLTVFISLMSCIVSYWYAHMLKKKGWWMSRKGFKRNLNKIFCSRKIHVQSQILLVSVAQVARLYVHCNEQITSIEISNEYKLFVG